MKYHYYERVGLHKRQYSVEDVCHSEIYHFRADSLKKEILDVNEQSLGRILWKQFLIFPGFRIQIPGKPDISVRQQLAFSEKYQVAGINWSIEIFYQEFDYAIVSDTDELICSIERVSDTNGKHYVLDVVKQEDILVCIGIVSGISACEHALR